MAKGRGQMMAWQKMLVRYRGWGGWLPGRALPAAGRVNFGSLRRVTPISRHFGFDRGQPVDRYFIEQFLSRHADDVQGRVLEVGDNHYTRAFGGERVTISDVLHVTEGHPRATFVADLGQPDVLPPACFDCIILTQTLHLLYDVRMALHTLYRSLVPGGVLLATVPGISPISTDEWGSSWYWSFTTRSVQRLLAEQFPLEGLRVEAHGNVLAATAFLYGLATHELRAEELDAQDPRYELLITSRAQKPWGEPT